MDWHICLNLEQEEHRGEEKETRDELKIKEGRKKAKREDPVGNSTVIKQKRGWKMVELYVDMTQRSVQIQFITFFSPLRTGAKFPDASWGLPRIMVSK